MNRFLNFMSIEPGELTIENLHADIDWTWLLIVAVFVLGMGVLRGGA